jgi:hypothetical protein
MGFAVLDHSNRLTHSWVIVVINAAKRWVPILRLRDAAKCRPLPPKYVLGPFRPDGT